MSNCDLHVEDSLTNHPLLRQIVISATPELLSDLDFAKMAKVISELVPIYVMSVFALTQWRTL